jgi:hypothetical protein
MLLLGGEPGRFRHRLAHYYSVAQNCIVGGYTNIGCNPGDANAMQAEFSAYLA